MCSTRYTASTGRPNGLTSQDLCTTLCVVPFVVWLWGMGCLRSTGRRLVGARFG